MTAAPLSPPSHARIRRSTGPHPDGPPDPVRVEGKFFWAGSQKFFLRGVTYGPFPPDATGGRFPDPETMARDFAQMAAAGVNTVRTFTAPSLPLLDAASAQGLRVLAGLAWPHHLAFLDDRQVRRAILAAMANEAREICRHPAILAYIIGNEIGPDLLRWHGARWVGAFLGELAATVREQHAGALVSYAGYPTAEYLQPEGVDFVSFNVYLHDEADFRLYLARLHNVAGSRPLVLSELGMDTIRAGEALQAEFLRGHLAAAFEAGVAGACVFAWSDEWHAGGALVTDWAFGLVRRDRSPKPALEIVADAYRASLPPEASALPRVSVVVCAYDAERTLEACLASLCRLNYRDYEVIVVDDGSRDRTAEIATRFPRCRLVRQRNEGLSAARNVGARTATGDIVAYTDADCVADPDWLHFLVLQFQITGYAAVGGPNLPPPEADLVPAAVAVSPGGPTHVLLSDSVAEHIAGCNMAVRRDVLLGLGGFDPIYRAAGDDVDLCWRLQDAGHRIGYAPAAMVWHFRRNTVAAYFGQQKGYGKAEALVWLKHPDRFNLWGQARWRGRIYGGLTAGLLPPRALVYGGAYGSAPFQMLYARPDHWAQYLPLTFEWNVLALLLAAVGIAAAPTDGRALLLVLPLLVSLGQAIATALRAPLEPGRRGVRARALVAYLVYLSPILRGWARVSWRRRIEGPQCRAVPRAAVSRRLMPPGLTAEIRSTSGVAKEALLAGLCTRLRQDRMAVPAAPSWRPIDLELPSGPWQVCRVLLASEHHGGNHRLHRARVTLAPSAVAVLALGALAALLSGLLLAGQGGGAAGLCAASLILLALWVRNAFGICRHVMARLEEAARDLGCSMGR